MTELPHPADTRQEATARLAVLGSPITLSQSPAIHTAAYRVLGLAWHYDRFEVQAAALPDFLAGLDSAAPEWLGFSVTMPLKTAAAGVSARLDPLAQRSGIVNTLLRVSDRAGTPSWTGFNTDVGGLATAIDRAGLDVRATVILGAGATAVSAVLAVRQLGAERVTVLARRREAVRKIGARFHVQTGVLHPSNAPQTRDDAPAWRQATLVVSTLPAAAGELVQLPGGFAAAPLFDVNYHTPQQDVARSTVGDGSSSAAPAAPLTPLARRWRSAGGAAHTGLAMLIEQALLQIRIFVHGDPAVPVHRESEVRAAMRAATA